MGIKQINCEFCGKGETYFYQPYANGIMPCCVKLSDEWRVISAYDEWGNFQEEFFLCKSCFSSLKKKNLKMLRFKVAIQNRATIIDPPLSPMEWRESCGGIHEKE